MSAKRILIIANSEIFYHARLLKAADFLSERGFDVVVFNPIVGAMNRSLYEEMKQKRNWKIHEYDITKASAVGKWRWLWTGLLNKGAKLAWNKFNLKIGFPYYFNKGLLGFSFNYASKADYVLINLVDTLPFASILKKKFNCRVIYDSQEYFTGQYSLAPAEEFNWVKKAEKEFIHQVDILLATTNAMRDRLLQEYKVNVPTLRVRNVPFKRSQSVQVTEEASKVLNLVWHGMTIFFYNRRGVHLLVEAASLCKAPVTLTLQGIMNPEQTEIFDELKEKFSLSEKLFHKEPASPDEIVESLYSFDVGVIGELPHEENERLTSSNKLFDFINAGLAVVAPGIEGLVETVDFYNVGLTYEPGSAEELAQKIDELYFDQIKLNHFRQNSVKASEKELFWENDYQAVINILHS